MVALNRPDEFRLHVRAAFNNGVTRDDIREVLLHCAIYAGVPAANSAFHMAEGGVRADGDASSLREDGTLLLEPTAGSGSHAGAREHRFQQHVTACGEVLGPRVLELVVTDAAFAGNEDHRRWRHAGEVHRVVRGAAHDVAMREIERLRALADRIDEVGRESAGRKVHDLAYLHVDATVRSELRAVVVRSSAIERSVASSAMRRSTLMRTSPGTTLREFGLTCM